MFSVGQRVRHITSDQRGTMRGIVDDWAWVQPDGEDMVVQMLLSCIAPEEKAHA